MCFLGSILVERSAGLLFSVYLLLWITSFVKNDALESNDEAKIVYKNTILISLALSLVILPVAGKIADTIPAFIFIPVCSVVRCAMGLQFQFFTNPASTGARLICALFVILSLLQRLGIETLLVRNVPRTVRALVVNIDEFAGLAGGAAFALTCGYLFDKYGPATPFSLVAILDFVYALIILVFICLGKLRN